METCVFCQIIDKKLPAEIWYEDDDLCIISTIEPLAPVHLLVIPRQHITSLNEASLAEASLLGRLLLGARKAAELSSISDSGYRTVLNTGAGGGQTVFHLHIHVLGGARIDRSLLTKGLR
jgi:histidine triad (HIT) family protein